MSKTFQQQLREVLQTEGFGYYDGTERLYSFSEKQFDQVLAHINELIEASLPEKNALIPVQHPDLDGPAGAWARKEGWCSAIDETRLRLLGGGE